MGLFSKIKKGFKKIFKGVKKVFKKVGKAVSKIMDNKWFKYALIAAAVVTGTFALAGAWSAATSPALAGQGFMAKFMAGAGQFITSMANPLQTVAGGLGGASAGGMAGIGQGVVAGTANTAAGIGASFQAGAGAVNATSAGTAGVNLLGAKSAEIGAGIESGFVPGQAGAGGALPGGAGTGAGAGAGTGAGFVVPPEPGSFAETVANAGGKFGSNPTGFAQSSGGGGMISNAWNAVKPLGSAAFDFAKSAGGGMLLGQALSGYGQGKMMEEEDNRRRQNMMSYLDPSNHAQFREIGDDLSRMLSQANSKLNKRWKDIGT